MVFHYSFLIASFLLQNILEIVRFFSFFFFFFAVAFDAAGRALVYTRLCASVSFSLLLWPLPVPLSLKPTNIGKLPAQQIAPFFSFHVHVTSDTEGNI